MPPVVAHDPALEADAMRVGRSAKDPLGMQPVKDSDQVLSARIVSDFHVVQNDLGIPVKREVAITLGVKPVQGQCYWVNVVFAQDHMGGGSYGGLHAEGVNDKAAMPCPTDGTTTTDAPAAAADPAAPASAQSAASPASPAAPASPTGAASPAAAAADANAGVKPADIDAAVDSLGPQAASDCKAYVREVCTRQKGPQSLMACKKYAESLGTLASTAQGPTVCKSMLSGLQKSH
jgi:hypothetical protein